MDVMRALRGGQGLVRRLIYPGGGAWERALLSVVVPFYDVVPYLAEAVDSLKRQTYPHLDVILVDDESSDGSLELARELTAGDPRFRVVTTVHGGLGAARNRGLELARGTYLTFMDADDIIPPDAYAAMVASLKASGSGMVLGNVERFDSTRAWIPGWAQAVHGDDVQGATLATLPAAMRDILACNRMYRRSFWDERVGSFPEGVVFEDHAPMLRAMLGGAPFDVLKQVTYRWRRREDGSSLSQPKDELANLEHRVRAKAEAWRILGTEGTDAERALWLARVLDLDLTPYLGHGGTAAPEYQDLLACTAATYLEHAEKLTAQGHDVASGVRSHRRLAAWYAAHRDWDALVSLKAALDVKRPPLARVVDDEITIFDRERPAIAPSLPRWLRALPPSTLAPQLTVTRTTWSSDAFVVVGTLTLGGVDVSPASASLVGSFGGEPVEVSLASAILRRADAPLTGTDINVRIEISAPVLSAVLPGDGSAALALTVQVGSITADARIIPGAGTRAPRPYADVRGMAHFQPAVTAETGVVVTRTAAATVLAAAIDEPDSVVLTLDPPLPAGTVAVLGSGAAALPLEGEGATWWIARELLATAVPDAPLIILEAASSPDEARRRSARTSRVHVPAALRATLPRGFAVSARAGLHAIPGTRRSLENIEAAEDSITLEFSAVGLADPPDDARWRAVLRGDDVDVPIAVTAQDAHAVTIPVPRRAPAPAATEQPTVASCRLTLVAADGDEIPLVTAGKVLDDLPVIAPSGAYDVRVIARRGGIEMRVEHLEPPAH